MVFENGESYEGEWQNNLFHGFGTFEMEKSRYIG